MIEGDGFEIEGTIRLESDTFIYPLFLDIILHVYEAYINIVGLCAL